jgi:hypothetical protein
MSTTGVQEARIAARALKPRGYVVPVVRPLPGRASGIGSDDTW